MAEETITYKSALEADEAASERAMAKNAEAGIKGIEKVFNKNLSKISGSSVLTEKHKSKAMLDAIQTQNKIKKIQKANNSKVSKERRLANIQTNKAAEKAEIQLNKEREREQIRTEAQLERRAKKFEQSRQQNELNEKLNAEKKAQKQLEGFKQKAVEETAAFENRKYLENNGRNEMAQKEYEELVAQYKAMEQLGAPEVDKEYGKFEREYNSTPKDYVPRETFAQAFARAQLSAQGKYKDLFEAYDATIKSGEKPSVEMTQQVANANRAANVSALAAVLKEKLGGAAEAAAEKLEELGVKAKSVSLKGDAANRPTSLFEHIVARGKAVGEGAKNFAGKAKTGAVSAFKKIHQWRMETGGGTTGILSLFSRSGSKSATKMLATIRQFSRAFKFKAIRQLISNILRLMKEGLKNLDEYSQHLGTPFHQNVLKLASSLLFLKNAFAAMVGPIINALTPALEKLMDAFAGLANHIGAFFAAVTGQNQFTAALKKTVTTTKQAAGKLKDILAFDELNRLSGDAGGGVSADEMFEEWGKGTIFQTMFEAVRDAKWKELGEILAKKVNGLVKAFDEKEFGKKLGERLGGAISIAASFFNNLDIVGAGSAIAGWFNRVIEGITWSDLGNLIARKFTGVIDFFAGLIGNLDWGGVAKALSDTIVGIFNGLGEWIKKVNWTKVGSDIVTNIKTFLENLDVNAILTTAAGIIEGILKALGKIADSLIESIFGGVPDWLHKLLVGDTTTIDLNANVAESVETYFSESADSLLGSIAEFLGIKRKHTGIAAGTAGLGQGVSNSTPSWAFTYSLQAGATLWDWLKNNQHTDETYVPSKEMLEKTTTISNVVKWIYDKTRDTNTSVNSILNKPILNAKKIIQAGLAGIGIGGYASGGTVDKGQLFIANEAGPELVGTVGGKTTVTNQDQFTQGLIDANETVVDAVMQVVRAVNNKNFDVYMDAQKVGKSVTTYQNNAARRYGV